MLRFFIAGSAAPEDVGRIDLFPGAFADEEQLLRTILHEGYHVSLRKIFLEGGKMEKLDSEALKADSNKEVRRVVGENLKRLRESKGLTREEFAAAVGISPLTIRNTEIGNISPKIPTLVKYADYYDISLDEIFGRGDYTDKGFLNYRLKYALEVAGTFMRVREFRDEVYITEQGELFGKCYVLKSDEFVKRIETLIIKALKSENVFERIVGA